MKAPENVETVLYYANTKPTETTWRRIVLGPFAKLVLAPGQQPPHTPTMGVESLEELEGILADFRTTLGSWVDLDSSYSSVAQDVLRTTIDRSKLLFKGWVLSHTTEQVFESWDTEGQTFSEMLYSKLLMALKEASFRALHRCVECSKFFYDPSKRVVMYCSKTCQSRVMMRRFRDRKKTEKRRAAKKKSTKRRARASTRTAK